MGDKEKLLAEIKESLVGKGFVRLSKKVVDGHMDYLFITDEEKENVVCEDKQHFSADREVLKSLESESICYPVDFIVEREMGLLVDMGYKPIECGLSAEDSYSF